MSEWQQFHGPNAGYLMELYEQYLADPQSVDEATRAFFAQWAPPEGEVGEVQQPLDVTRVVGAARLIRQRESFHDLLRFDAAYL